MKHPKFRHGLLAAALAALLAPAPAVLAQSSAAEERAQESSTRAGGAAQRARGSSARNAKSENTQRAAELYPEATREPAATKASAKMSPKLQKMVDRLDADKPDEARAMADQIIADGKANAYDRAFAAQVGAQAAYDADDVVAATQYLNKALEANGLDNNAHYGAMLMLAQLQLQEDNYAEGLATLERFLSETKSQNPEHLVLKGNALYRLDRFPEAAAVLKQAVDASPEPKSDWLQLLMGAYLENNQPEEAAKVAESVAAKNPNDKRAQMNLAAVHLQNDRFEKGAEVYERLRAAGQLTEESEYRNLYVAYYNVDGKQAKVIEIINEGLQKGILKPDHQTYLALAQAHYDLEQAGPAIDAYKKAAPLAENGETYLNLARMLWQEDRIAEAKEAAKQAIAKGLKNPADANKIIALQSN